MSFNYVNSYIDQEYKEIYRSGFRKFNVTVFACFKYISDRIIAVFGTVVLFPIMLIIAFIIKIDSKGPILFRQNRTGKGGKKIVIYKFRTMVVDNDVYDYSKEDECTKIGRFLRKTSLDELPQIISILKGDMSFIGPRPWIHDYYINMNEFQRYRYSVRPGLTGLAQINGRNNITIFEKIRYDLEYIENYSLKQDIKILFITIKKVLKAEGVNAGKDGIHKELSDLKAANGSYVYGAAEDIGAADNGSINNEADTANEIAEEQINV